MPEEAADEPPWCARCWSVSDCDGSSVTSAIQAAWPALRKGEKRCARGLSPDGVGNSAAIVTPAMSRCSVGGDRNVRFSRPSLPAAERQEPA